MRRRENIVLTGFSGTGKSQVGRQVALMLGWRFVDTDEEIVSQAGKPVHRIFGEEGEAPFRTLESRVLREVLAGERQVVSTGGGAIVDPANLRLVLRRGLLVCLEARPETICQRLQENTGDAESDVRPLLAGSNPLKRIRTLKAARQPFYARARWTIHTDDLTIEEAARETVRAWQLLQGRGRRSDPDLAAVVHHSAGSYPILAGWGLLARVAAHLNSLGIRGPVYIISDGNIFDRHGRKLQWALEEASIASHCYIIPPGESSKSLEMARCIYEWLAERKAERGQAILALGGGVVGDLAGFVAATYLRGIPLVQLPTSLAAMVDAAIGGKVAVNLPVGKNLVGAFYQPRLVLADLETLSTLPRRELAEGWAEAIKAGLILDADLFDTMERHAEGLLALERGSTSEVVRRSMAIKARIVTQDEWEISGRRILLNYGHTIGHALEAATGYQQYLHGEAVSVGMMGAALLSQRLGLIPAQVVQRQRQFLERFGLPLRCPGVAPRSILRAMTLDKKVRGGALQWVVLEDVGRAVVRRRVPTALVREVVHSLAR